jgi:RNA polymerase sigma-B factor
MRMDALTHTIVPRAFRRADEPALFRRYRETRDRSVRAALVERYLPLARHFARRYPSAGEREDVQQVAYLGLVKAVDRFDPERGIAFSSFATPTILGEIKRYFRDCGWSVHVPRELQDRKQRIDAAAQALMSALGRSPTPNELAAELGVSVEEVLEALATATAHRPVPLDKPDGDSESAPTPRLAVEDAGFARADDAVVIDGLLGLLGERERAIIVLRFRYDLLQREIAALLGISQMQVSRVLTATIARLTHHVEEAPA